VTGTSVTGVAVTVTCTAPFTDFFWFLPIVVASPTPDDSR
jgi:hypothetical protein